MRKTIGGTLIVIAVIGFWIYGYNRKAKNHPKPSTAIEKIGEDLTNLTESVMRNTDTLQRSVFEVKNNITKNTADLMEVASNAKAADEKAAKSVAEARQIKKEVTDQGMLLNSIQEAIRNHGSRLGDVETRVENLSSNAMNMANDFNDVRRRAQNAETLAKNAEAKASDALTIASATRTHQEKMAEVWERFKQQLTENKTAGATAVSPASVTKPADPMLVARADLSGGLPSPRIVSRPAYTNLVSAGPKTLEDPRKVWVGRGPGGGKARIVGINYYIALRVDKPIPEEVLKGVVGGVITSFNSKHGGDYAEKFLKRETETQIAFGEAIGPMIEARIKSQRLEDTVAFEGGTLTVSK